MLAVTCLRNFNQGTKGTNLFLKLSNTSVNIAPYKFAAAQQKFDFATLASNREVNDLFHLWNDALATLDSTTVAKRYASKSILLPTVSDTPRQSFDTIKAYFDDFLKKQPQGVILDSFVEKGEDWALDAGVYEFTMGATGDKVKARYTFLYKYENGEWKIAHHHSSVMPEAFLG